MTVVAAVLAAGASSRLGRPKQLVLLDGEPLVRREARAAAAPGIDQVAVVLGAHADAVGAALDSHVTRVYNEAWSEGIAASLRSAVRWAQARDAAALAVVLADQPFVGAAQVGALVAAWKRGALASASTYDGVLGAPAVFDARLFAQLLALRGDAGAGKLLRIVERVARVPCERARIDVDTPDDLARISNDVCVACGDVAERCCRGEFCGAPNTCNESTNRSSL